MSDGEYKLRYMDEWCNIAVRSENFILRPNCGREIVVTPFSPLATEGEIGALVGEYGTVASSRVTKKEVFVIEMYRKEGASLALAALPGRLLHGKPIKAFWSTRVKQEVPELEEPPIEAQPIPSWTGPEHGLLELWRKAAQASPRGAPVVGTIIRPST